MPMPRRYPSEFVFSLFALAITYAKLGRGTDACQTMERLAKQSPDSKYVARGKEVCDGHPD